jgi:transglutaminase/protease-like cytokinesis protein 3
MFINRLNRFPSFYEQNFSFYKNISEQYNDHSILDCVKQLLPDTVLNSYMVDRSLKPLLNWFKNDFMKWMSNKIQCSSCKILMRVQLLKGDSLNSRATEIYTCDKCQSTIIFPRYTKILKIAETRIGRCSEWSILFGAILNSLSIQTRIVHDYLDHCWNESLIDKNWMHVDSTLDYPISFNHPQYYEQNWGKEYEYILAFSANTIEDVTINYTEKWQIVQKRRRKNDKIDLLKKMYLKA